MSSPAIKVEKLYYTIGEVAEMLDVNTSLIRYWEKEFTNVKPRKNRHGNRLFTAKDIEALKFIHHLVKEKGHTLEGAKKLVKEGNNNIDSKYAAIHTLQKIRSFLVDLRDSI